MKLPTLRTMTQAGGKLLPELHREFAEYARKEGKKFIVMYGQTEATARMGLPAGRTLSGKVRQHGHCHPRRAGSASLTWTARRSRSRKWWVSWYMKGPT